MRTSPTNPRPPAPRRQLGFTLVELLIASTIAAVVMAAVYTTYSGAHLSEQRIQEITEANQRWRFFAQRLQSDLRNLFALDSPFIGAGTELELTVQVGRELHRVRYYFSPAGGDGEIRRRGVRDEHSQISRVYSGVEAIRFRYHIAGQWRDTALGLPAAVECVLSGKDWSRRLTVGLEVTAVNG